MDSDFEHHVSSAAKVLTQGDTFNLNLPLTGGYDERTIHRHLTKYDPTSWLIIQRRMSTVVGFVDAVFAKIKTLEGVQFEVRELASLLITLPGGETIRGQLERYTIGEDSSVEL